MNPQIADDAETGPIIDLGLGQPAPNGLARNALPPGERGDCGGQGGVLLLGMVPDEPHAPRSQPGGCLYGFRQAARATDDDAGGVVGSSYRVPSRSIA